MRRVKRKDYENLSDENLKKVIGLLEQDKPITKKEACEILNISYNTSRLSKIVEEFKERQAYIAQRKRQNRGKPATNAEISEAVMYYLQGDSITEIAKMLYRSPSFVKELIDKVGVPIRPASAEDKKHIDIVPEECTSESFSEGEIVWSAVYHSTAIVRKELSKEYVNSKSGLGNTDYEAKYGSKCYQIYVLEKVDSEDSLFPMVESGGFSAYALAYDLAKLSHLEKFGVDVSRI